MLTVAWLFEKVSLSPPPILCFSWLAKTQPWDDKFELSLNAWSVNELIHKHCLTSPFQVNFSCLWVFSSAETFWACKHELKKISTLTVDLVTWPVSTILNCVLIIWKAQCCWSATEVILVGSNISLHLYFLPNGFVPIFYSATCFSVLLLQFLKYLFSYSEVKRNIAKKCGSNEKVNTLTFSLC